MRKSIAKDVWVQKVVEHMQCHGCIKFVTFVNEEETAVILRGFRKDGTFIDRVAHRIQMRRSDGSGLRAVYARRDRLSRWSGQYDHWLAWALIKIKRQKEEI